MRLARAPTLKTLLASSYLITPQKASGRGAARDGTSSWRVAKPHTRWHNNNASPSYPLHPNKSQHHHLPITTTQQPASSCHQKPSATSSIRRNQAQRGYVGTMTASARPLNTRPLMFHRSSLSTSPLKHLPLATRSISQSSRLQQSKPTSSINSIKQKSTTLLRLALSKLNDLASSPPCVSTWLAMDYQLSPKSNSRPSSYSNRQQPSGSKLAANLLALWDEAQPPPTISSASILSTEDYNTMACAKLPKPFRKQPSMSTLQKSRTSGMKRSKPRLACSLHHLRPPHSRETYLPKP